MQRSRNLTSVSAGAATFWVGAAILFAVAVARLASAGALVSVTLLGLPVVIGLATHRQAHVRAWVGFVAVLSAFVLLRSLADETGVPWRPTYALVGDRFLGLGLLPSSRLQAWSQPWLDRLATSIYGAFFAVPVAAGLLTWKSMSLLEHYVRAVAAALAIALFVHFALPTVPPWLAAARGLVQEPFRRIAWEVLNPAAPQLVESARHASANDVAAMPSVHVALSLLAAAGLWRVHMLAGMLGWLYALAISVAVVYLGEHYAVDVVAGAALAYCSWKIAAPPQSRGKRTVPAGAPLNGSVSSG